ncbi:uncharacterized protein LOC111319808 [Stylophora pistillata]|uniref:uncharacterized protein LOC111319808 n=1 Tax=Stylophora pistillata TaxID=50429 RepID=UPI000C04BB81|nr:uncharacterized protein LOC111319808 [Stylophora pistillata]
MVREHGLKFIGPSPEHIQLMGDKITAKDAVQKLGIPVVPGSDGPVTDIESAVQIAEEMGYPVIVKAASGGGGKGMQVCHNTEELREKIPLAQTEAKINFGNDQVFVEKYLMKPRHIEIQVLGDSFGNAVHLGERDCSLQRRHQKVWEEATSPAVTEEKRHKLGEIVRKAVAEMGYEGAGTFEFLYENDEFYFIEMNTRIQVEHTITEMVTDVDLVREQIRVAQGEKLSFSQKDVQFRGHAIECRINAEHPETFAPSPGKITGYHAPGGIGVRVDSHLYAGYSIPPHYDSMISKLIVFADTREKCILRLRRALDEYIIEGPQTIIPLHQKLAQNPDVIAGNYDIHWLENWLKEEEEKKASAGQAA